MVTIKNQEFTIRELVGLKNLMDTECERVAKEVRSNHEDVVVSAHNHYATPTFSIWNMGQGTDCGDNEEYEGFRFSKGVEMTQLEFELVRQEIVDSLGGV